MAGSDQSRHPLALACQLIRCRSRAAKNECPTQKTDIVERRREEWPFPDAPNAIRNLCRFDALSHCTSDLGRRDPRPQPNTRPSPKTCLNSREEPDEWALASAQCHD
ncbi:unnamed protein product [Bursaphelenchus okinawaensis]|uniref:Uncharacterized protein n=1 Tax=Bursaphelenchus okinawaensis TaxID=465554 RepID=A0A811JR98_9BILA|nr:unnamed protein product [Bursaphelenchus okinawaensis]CAG9079261.1 unnamed protein product [Bursaphelenchus okinawaensis]